jgi:hypothetical protein
MSLFVPLPQTTCGLYSGETGSPIATASPVTAGPNMLVAMTQVVTLSSPTTLELECTNPFGPPPSPYTNLSMYALSFATT